MAESITPHLLVPMLLNTKLMRGLCVEEFAHQVVQSISGEDESKVPDNLQIIFGKTEGAMAIGSSGALSQITGPVWRLLSCCSDSPLRLQIAQWLSHDPVMMLKPVANGYCPEDLNDIIQALDSDDDSDEAQLIKQQIRACIACAVLTFYSFNFDALTALGQHIADGLGEEESGLVLLDAVKMRSALRQSFRENCELAGQISNGQPQVLVKVLESYEEAARDNNADLTDFLVSVTPGPAAEMDAFLAQPSASEPFHVGQFVG